MGKGKNAQFENDWISSFDPRIAPGLAALKGTLFRHVPSAGLAQLLLKQDNGLSQNWSGLQTTPAKVYYVASNGEFTTIQGAINKAVADGAGGGNFATIYVAPGLYVENLVFAAGLAIIGMTSPAGIQTVSVQGQHVYNPGIDPNPLNNALVLNNLTFLDPDIGNTITFGGAGDAFFQVSQCNYAKAGASGSWIYSAKVGSIFVVAQSAVIGSSSVDPVFNVSCIVTVMQNVSHSSGASSAFLDYNGSPGGSCVMSICQVQAASPYVISLTGGGMLFSTFNFLSTLLPDSDCIKVAAGVQAHISNCTLTAPAGTGYVLQGSGTVEGAMIVYGIVNTKDPALTFNLLPSDP